MANDYDDLCDNSSPYKNGTPPIDASVSSDYPPSDAPGYYSPVAQSSTDNSNSAGAGVYSAVESALARGTAAGIDAAYAAASEPMENASSPATEDYSIDNGLDDQEVPLGERR